MENRVVLTGLLAEQAALRYTPAGLPALDLRIEHSSQQQELGSARNVNASVKAVAFGALAEKLARQAPGSQWTFQGFLATPRNSKMLVLHIQDIQQN
ncbi:primosomal replication protein N [Comamonas testosteroni]|uniref:Replication restart protein PriB n=2 Tax=Comamonas testosteroni TaxID=285 RepID=A0A5A7M8V9_COMTE|nr:MULTISPECIES: primosomal replication protein N [Comamonas]AIJ45283.1 single-stranded DNA-binding protein [Comamonas testosteroni TK102]EHN65346.1 single-strand binding protein/Primosomal [Comamonas testosteroni ATCC 11996]MPS88461.1 primosomal replication protein N [Comamonas sp.]QQN70050.1 primosomal replication protein N [Comamonas testosteroni]TYK72652.1 primosomal replication protein N [Comamonas sp. Z3]